MTEPKSNPFNLTYPPVPFNRTGMPVIYDNEGDTGMPAILAGLLIPHIVCTLFILARTSSRLLLLRKWFLDDTLIILAWAFSTAVCIVYSIAASTPSILVAPDRDESLRLLPDGTWVSNNVHAYLMRNYLGLVFYQLCLCLTKLSILAFYIRMFGSRPLERRLAWATVVFVLLYGVPMLFMSIFQCHPSEGQFFGKPMACFGFAPLLIASASLHTATDAWLIVMIVPCISRLDLPPRQKVALAVVLSLSIFVIAASLVRLQLSLHRHYRPAGGEATGETISVTNTLAFFVMTVLECDIALICASAPTLRPLLARVFPRLMNEDEKKRRSAQQQGLDAEANSFYLTSVVSYHGYPWTEPATPLTRSRNRSVGSRLDGLSSPGSKMPVPPVPALTANHRTPTSLSLRTMISGMAPRSRGRTMTGTADERPILHSRGNKEGEPWDGSRRSSAGFDYQDQFLYGGDQKLRRHSRASSGLGIYMHTRKRSSGVGSDRRWGESQESFVLGLNDPMSPSRLSPVSGLSGETYAAQADALSLKGESIDGRIELVELAERPKDTIEERQDEADRRASVQANEVSRQAESDAREGADDLEEGIPQDDASDGSKGDPKNDQKQ